MEHVPTKDVGEVSPLALVCHTWAKAVATLRHSWMLLSSDEPEHLHTSGPEGPYQWLTVLASGHICVCGSLDGFDLFSADGRFERTVDISLAGSSALPDVASIGAAADATHLYISHDYGGLLKLRQVDFGVVARHSSLWPEGEEHKQLEEPRGLAVSDGLLYVADHGNGRIAVFASSGPTLTYARSFCGPGEKGFPSDVDVANGLIYVVEASYNHADEMHGSLLIFFAGR
jgi:hypothetical protein